VVSGTREKDDGHAIQYGITENPMLHANFTALSSIESRLLRFEVLHCSLGIFARFCPGDLDLDSMIFIYELDLYSLKLYRMTEKELPTSRLSKVIVVHKYIQTRHRNHIGLGRFLGGKMVRILAPTGVYRLIVCAEQTISYVTYSSETWPCTTIHRERNYATRQYYSVRTR